ncbi:MAG: ABC transporter permease [Deltaproteobacteria bacterium]|jgi:putative ABC transport system permease protein|nr:ABC transporter permease [Deltaproteobacteria bacterium]
MSFFAAFRVALRALTRNLTRTFLTVLGIVIGVAAVIAMMAAGAGAREQIKAVFETMGTNMLVIRPQSDATTAVRGGEGSAASLTFADVDAIRTECAAVQYAAAVLQTRAQIGAEEANWNTQVTGTTPDFLTLRQWPAEIGKSLNEEHEQSSAKVVVLGQTVAWQLFGDGSPIGRVVRIKNTPFEVIGVLSKKGQAPNGQDYDDTVFIPLATYRTKIEGGLGDFLRGSIYVSASTPEQVMRAEGQVTALLRERHRTAPGAEDDFRVRNLAEFATAREQTTGTITTLLAAIAAVSLVVGGIGVMNIMMVSVVERTREIGIRMAVGARPIDLLVQFLVEALVLSGIGGLLGLGLGAIAADQLAKALGWISVFPTETALMAIGVASGVGIVFGLYPAIKASRLDPIVALRTET